MISQNWLFTFHISVYMICNKHFLLLAAAVATRPDSTHTANLLRYFDMLSDIRRNILDNIYTQYFAILDENVCCVHANVIRNNNARIFHASILPPYIRIYAKLNQTELRVKIKQVDIMFTNDYKHDKFSRRDISMCAWVSFHRTYTNINIVWKKTELLSRPYGKDTFLQVYCRI